MREIYRRISLVAPSDSAVLIRGESGTGKELAARECLMQYGWPGNVRELENAIEHAVVLGTTDSIAMEDLPEAVIEARQPSQPPGPKFYQAIVEAKRHLILEAIGQADGNYTEAARLLGVHPNNLHRLIRTLDLKTLLDK